MLKQDYCIIKMTNQGEQKTPAVIYTFICYSAYANRHNGEECSTEMLTYMYNNRGLWSQLFGLRHAYKGAALYRNSL